MGWMSHHSASATPWCTARIQQWRVFLVHTSAALLSCHPSYLLYVCVSGQSTFWTWCCSWWAVELRLWAQTCSPPEAERAAGACTLESRPVFCGITGLAFGPQGGFGNLVAAGSGRVQAQQSAAQEAASAETARCWKGCREAALDGPRTTTVSGPPASHPGDAVHASTAPADSC